MIKAEKRKALYYIKVVDITIKTETKSVPLNLSNKNNLKALPSQKVALSLLDETIKTLKSNRTIWLKKLKSKI